jgi:hypothetical protein
MTRLARTRAEMRAVTTSALVFGAQKVSSRVDLVYLGGIGFSRVSRHYSYDSSPVLASLLPTRFDIDSAQYGVGPVVGVEARMAFSAHARLVAGVRLHAPGSVALDGWLIRPGAGVSWSF